MIKKEKKTNVVTKIYNFVVHSSKENVSKEINF